MAWNAFPLLSLAGAKPLVPFGKAEKFSGRREHGTPDHAVLPALGRDGRPFSSRPGSSGGGVIAGFGAKARPGYPQMKVERSSLHRRKPDIALRDTLAPQLAAV